MDPQIVVVWGELTNFLDTSNIGLTGVSPWLTELHVEQKKVADWPKDLFHLFSTFCN